MDAPTQSLGDVFIGFSDFCLQMVPEVCWIVSNIQKLGSFRDAESSENFHFFLPLEKNGHQKTLLKPSQEFSNQIVGPRLCGSDDKRRGAFCASKLLPPTVLESKFCPEFFPIGLWTLQVSVKLQAGHWGMYEKWRCDSRFFFEVQNIYCKYNNQ